MRHLHPMALATALLAGGCSYEAPEPDVTKTLELRANAQGDLEYCDASGTCETFPNPGQCAVLVVVIDNITGQTCETCEDAAGDVLYNSCSQTQIACVVVTAPEPDCLVCAHVGGSVIYSTCIAEQPNNCVPQTLPDGSTCKACYNDFGQVILDECPRCIDAICPAVACGPGFQEVLRPGECCGSCQPIDACDNVACPLIALPECPPGTKLTRDLSDCCSYYCAPTECSPSSGTHRGIACQQNSDCAAIGTACINGVCGGGCPPGYKPDPSFPSCGSCVPDHDYDYCFSDGECAPGEYCSFDMSYCNLPFECGCWDDCDAKGNCYTVCVDCACPGLCKPIDWHCPDFAAPDPDACEGGSWEFGGIDANGCALPPICVCPDGTIATDWVCDNACDLVLCPAVAIDCAPGFHLESVYPYCCGICVPDVQCFADPCGTIDCQPGFECKQGPNCTATCEPTEKCDPSPCHATDCAPGYECHMSDSCEPTCVQVEKFCYSDHDCGPDKQCSTSRGDCRLPPGCANGAVCPAVCAGVCEAPQP